MGEKSLLVALGWSLDDFVSEFATVSVPVLEETLRILEDPTPAPNVELAEKAASGARAIRRELINRGR